MSIFNNTDFSQVHDMVTCCIIDYLIKGVQQFGQKVSSVMITIIVMYIYNKCFGFLTRLIATSLACVELMCMLIKKLASTMHIFKF